MSDDDHDDLEDLARQLELTKLKVAQLTRELEARKRSKLMREAKNPQFDAATQKIENAITQLKVAIRNDEQQDQ
jgi:replicative DNA helicase